MNLKGWKNEKIEKKKMKLEMKKWEKMLTKIT